MIKALELVQTLLKNFAAKLAFQRRSFLMSVLVSRAYQFDRKDQSGGHGATILTETRQTFDEPFSVNFL